MHPLNPEYLLTLELPLKMLNSLNESCGHHLLSNYGKETFCCK